MKLNMALESTREYLNTKDSILKSLRNHLIVSLCSRTLNMKKSKIDKCSNQYISKLTNQMQQSVHNVEFLLHVDFLLAMCGHRSGKVMQTKVLIQRARWKEQRAPL